MDRKFLPSLTYIKIYEAEAKEFERFLIFLYNFEKGIAAFFFGTVAATGFAKTRNFGINFFFFIISISNALEYLMGED